MYCISKRTYMGQGLVAMAVPLANAKEKQWKGVEVSKSKKNKPRKGVGVSSLPINKLIPSHHKNIPLAIKKNGGKT